MKKIHPLFAFYIVVSLLTYSVTVYQNTSSSMMIMNYFMGFSFIGLGFLKIISIESFVALYRKYDIVAKKFSFYAYAYPFIETILGFWFLFIGDNLIIDTITLVVLTINFITILNVMNKKENVSCVCMGDKFLLKFDKWLILENILMLAMIIYMLFAMYNMQNMNNVDNFSPMNGHDMNSHNMEDMDM